MTDKPTYGYLDAASLRIHPVLCAFTEVTLLLLGVARRVDLIPQHLSTLGLREEATWMEPYFWFIYLQTIPDLGAFCNPVGYTPGEMDYTVQLTSQDAMRNAISYHCGKQYHRRTAAVNFLIDTFHSFAHSLYFFRSSLVVEASVSYANLFERIKSFVSRHFATVNKCRYITTKLMYHEVPGKIQQHVVLLRRQAMQSDPSLPGVVEAPIEQLLNAMSIKSATQRKNLRGRTKKYDELGFSSDEEPDDDSASSDDDEYLPMTRTRQRSRISQKPAVKEKGYCVKHRCKLHKDNESKHANCERKDWVEPKRKACSSRAVKAGKKKKGDGD